MPLFESYGVQLVLSGHDHNYQRFAAQNGVTYVVHGGRGCRAGSALSGCAGCSEPSYPIRGDAGRRSAEHGFLYVASADARSVDAVSARRTQARGRGCPPDQRFALTP